MLHACLQLDLFAKLADGPRPAAALAPLLGMTTERATRLLDAAVALDLLTRRPRQPKANARPLSARPNSAHPEPARYGLGPLGAALVDNPAIAAMVAHHTMLYADLADPVALLRATRPDTALGRYWNYAPDGSGGASEAYTALMAASQALIAEEVLAAYDLRRHRRLLDVGGGDGSFLQEAAAAAPDLHIVLFDLPAIADRAATRFANAGLQHRATTAGGSFLTDDLPGSCDIASLVRVLHDHDDAPAAHILAAIHAALPPGGTLLLAEPMADTDGAEPIGDAYFGFYLLAMGRGKPRSAEILSAMLRDAGFAQVAEARTRTPALVRVLVARKSIASTA